MLYYRYNKKRKDEERMDIAEKIIEVLEYFADKVGIAINWTSDNILPYVQQILAKY